jgi:hypothetical protein
MRDPINSSMPDRNEVGVAQQAETQTGAEQVGRWLQEADAAVPATSNQPAIEMAFQRWFKFKEAFAPSFVIETIQKLPYPAETCLDPFGGSGTTALTCQFLGIEPSTIEVNPFMADIIEAKLVKYDVDELREDFATVLRRAKRDWPTVDLNSYFEEGPNTLVEPGWDGGMIAGYFIGLSRRLSLRCGRKSSGSKTQITSDFCE